MVDFPGYGPTPLAATDRSLRRSSIDRTRVEWGRLVRRCARLHSYTRPTRLRTVSQRARPACRYLRTRAQLRCVFVLVESTLGLAPSDIEFLDVLRRLEVGLRLAITSLDPIVAVHRRRRLVVSRLL